MTKKSGPCLNMSGTFKLPTHETVTQTANRLSQGESLGWPGSISIHGHMRAMRPRTDVEKVHKKQLVKVFDVEFRKYIKEYV